LLLQPDILSNDQRVLSTRSPTLTSARLSASRVQSRGTISSLDVLGRSSSSK
jgi:hypothetical protein